MVGRWGMSEAIGLVSRAPGPATSRCSPGRPTPAVARRRASSSTARCAGSSTSATCARVEQLRENRERLDGAGDQALLERETLDEDEAYEAAGFERGSAPGDRPPHGMLKEPSVRSAPAALDAAPSDTTT